MKNALFPSSTAAALAAALLSGCTNIKDDQARTRTEGGLAGAGVGAVAGAIIGNQMGHHSWQGALIGGAVGGAAGVAYGDHVARKKAKYATQEAWLNDCIASAQKANSKARAYNNSLTKKIADLETKINAAKARGDKGELQGLKRATLSLQTQTREEIKKVDAEISEQNRALKEAGNSSGGTTLRTQVGELRSTQSSLNQNETKIADLLRRMDV